MKKLLGIALTCGVCVTTNAAVENVTMEQDDTRRVTVKYDLTGDEPMIVTIDIVTNGNVSVGGKQMRHFSGAVNRLVQPGKCTCYWMPNRDMPKIDKITAKAVVTAWKRTTPPDYMVVNLLESESTNLYAYYADIDAIPDDFKSEIYKTKKMVFRRVPSNGAVYRMGSPSTEAGRDGNREIPHYVTFTNDFWVGIYPLTVGQYATVVNGSATLGTAGCKPQAIDTFGSVRGTNWPNSPGSGSFLGKFRVRTGLAADLPTDAFYEFAHRAGVDGPICVSGYSYPTDSSKVYWFGQSEWKEVGLLEPNAWHLYDMAGNGTTYCLDYYYGGDDYRNTFGDNYKTEPLVDPINPDTTSDLNSHKVIRGSRYNSGVGDTRPAHRFWSEWNRVYCAIRLVIRID